MADDEITGVQDTGADATGADMADEEADEDMDMDEEE